MIKVYMKDDFDYSKYVVNSPYFIRKDKNTYYFLLNNTDCINLCNKLNLNNNDIIDCLIECSNNIFTLYFWETFHERTGNNHNDYTTYYYGCYCNDSLDYSDHNYNINSDDIIKLRKCDNRMINPIPYEIFNYFSGYFNENYSNINYILAPYPKYIFNNQHNSKYISIDLNKAKCDDLIQDMTSFIDSLKSVKSQIKNSPINTHILMPNPGYIDSESDEYKYGINKKQIFYDEENDPYYSSNRYLYSKDYVDENAPDDDYYDDENLPDDYYY